MRTKARDGTSYTGQTRIFADLVNTDYRSATLFRDVVTLFGDIARHGR